LAENGFIKIDHRNPDHTLVTPAASNIKAESNSVVKQLKSSSSTAQKEDKKVLAPKLLPENKPSLKPVEPMADKTGKAARTSESSTDDYEHIYCEIEPKAKPRPEPETRNAVAYTNNAKSILEIQPLKLTGSQKGGPGQPVRPSRSKILKKATSLDSEDSRVNTPATQLLDRAPQLFDRGLVRLGGPPPPRLRSASGDQGSHADRAFPSAAPDPREKRRSFHHCPTDSFPDPFVPAFQPEKPAATQKPDLNDRLKSGKPSAVEVTPEVAKPLANGDVSKMKPTAAERPRQPKPEVPASRSGPATNGAAPKDVPEIPETRKRRSGNFDDVAVGSRSLKLKDGQKASKPKSGHSKLTKSEEKYIADLLMSKMAGQEKEKPKTRVPERVREVHDEVEEQRKKGAIRKRPLQDRPPPLQEPASRPHSSFIMDDVLYTSR
jgi:hypothetical protein